MGNKKSLPNLYNMEDAADSDLPSEIGEDQWGEIPKYWY